MTHLVPYQSFRQHPGKLSRLKYHKLCDALAAVLMLPPDDVPLIAEAVAEAVHGANRLPVTWLSFQDCTGDTGAFFRSSRRPIPGRPRITDSPILNLLSDMISLDYHWTPAIPSSPASVLSLYHALQNRSSSTVCILEGDIPLDENGHDPWMSGRNAWRAIQKFLPQTQAVITLESCSGNGNGTAGPVHTTSVREALPDLKNLICLPGRPTAVFDLVACLVYVITFDHLPPVDLRYRPYFS